MTETGPAEVAASTPGGVPSVDHAGVGASTSPDPWQLAREALSENWNRREQDLARELLSALAELDQVKKERDRVQGTASELTRTARSEQVRANRAVAERDRLAVALRQIRALDHDDFDTAFRYEQSVRMIANEALASMEGDK